MNPPKPDTNPSLRYRPLEDDLQATAFIDPSNPANAYSSGPVLPTSPSLDPAGRKPFMLTDGAAAFGQLTVTYDADAGAGNFSGSKTFSPKLDGLPLGFVWYLGAVDSVDGTVLDTGAGLLNRVETYANLNSEIYSGNAGASWTSTGVTVFVESTNTSYANPVTGYFYYTFYYDDLQVKSKGL